MKLFQKLFKNFVIQKQTLNSCNSIKQKMEPPKKLKNKKGLIKFY